MNRGVFYVFVYISNGSKYRPSMEGEIKDTFVWAAISVSFFLLNDRKRCIENRYSGEK